MVIIHFVDGSEWYKANWVFRQLAGDLVAHCPDDADLKITLERAEALGLLKFDYLGNDLAARLKTAMLEVATATQAGTILGWKGSRPNDKQGHDDYLEALKELAEMIRSKQRG
jgi:hypothetical protein